MQEARETADKYSEEERRHPTRSKEELLLERRRILDRIERLKDQEAEAKLLPSDERGDLGKEMSRAIKELDKLRVEWYRNREIREQFPE